MLSCAVQLVDAGGEVSGRVGSLELDGPQRSDSLFGVFLRLSSSLRSAKLKNSFFTEKTIKTLSDIPNIMDIDLEPTQFISQIRNEAPEDLKPSLDTFSDLYQRKSADFLSLSWS